MRIGMLGSGNVGRALGGALVEAGHRVVVGTRSPEGIDLQEWAVDVGVELTGVLGAVEAAEVVVLATSWAGAQNALTQAGAALDGKVLVDVTNPLRLTDRIELAVGHTDSGGEQVQRWAPAAKVVKAFNTVGYELMDHPATSSLAPTLFVATDHDEARVVATELAFDLGWDVHDCGPLRMARVTEPLALLWIEHAMRSGRRNFVFSRMWAEPRE